MVLRFNFREDNSAILGKIYRPMAQVFIWSAKDKLWTEVWMLVDSGADYTLLPRFMADKLRVDLEKDCKLFSTYGVGGGERVYFLPKIKVRLGKWKREIPVGFLERNEIPPLLGRHQFMETFETNFSPRHVVSFSS
jgi:hypothetical protein